MRWKQMAGWKWREMANFVHKWNQTNEIISNETMVMGGGYLYAAVPMQKR
jgi:hypothetical protein